MFQPQDEMESKKRHIHTTPKISLFLYVPVWMCKVVSQNSKALSLLRSNKSGCVASLHLFYFNFLLQYFFKNFLKYHRKITFISVHVCMGRRLSSINSFFHYLYKDTSLHIVS